ncbi:hypothetical protein H9Q74_011103 [Fusarium xylarioides]|nr:hypothetical protein H9Q71_011249 [Fusarium xylarioides]KAG5816441.1 hypothetical protein H9Q74_011103 [Fusarium xylarioides]
MSDFLSSAYYEFPWGNGHFQEVGEVWKDASKYQDCAEVIAGYLPTSLEVLVLGNSMESTSMGMEEDILIRIIRIIRSNKLLSLKAIFIEVPDDGDEIYSLTKLCEVGWENGVDIHVKTHPQVPRQQIQLPMAPQAISHQSRHHAEQLEFDPFKGCWMEAARDTRVDEQASDMSVDDVFEALDEDVETDDDYADLHRQYYG